MKATFSFLAASSLLSVVGTTAAGAEEIVLSFDLPTAEAAAASQGTATADVNALLGPGPQPLPIPASAGNPPMRSHSSQQLPSGVYRQAVAAGLTAGQPAAALLPPAPPLVRVATTAPVQPSEPTPPTPASAGPSNSPGLAPLALSFEIAPLEDEQVAAAKPAPTPTPQLPANPLLSLFEGGTDSLVARAVGSAEGTRTPSGGITTAYYGHRDPGNGVWNMGTFSYQHGASSAAEADQKQLHRLQSQSQVLQRRAIKHGLTLTLEETLNGIDLANQSPLASIGRVGYIERLVEARQMGHTGSEAIVVARTRSYINPDTQRWNAPGLGNTLASITRDQRRRANAVAQAMAVYQRENAHIDWSHWALLSDAQSTAAALSPDPPAQPAWEPADIAFGLWTDGQDTPDQNPADPVAISVGTAQSSADHRPRWIETRERFQSMEPRPDPAQDNAPALSPPPGTPASRATVLDPMKGSGAVPETRVLPPLKADFEPAALPPLAQHGEDASSATVAANQTRPSLQLPEGLLHRLQDPTGLEDHELGTRVKSVREQITAAILAMDLPTVPGLE
jgi:hypothetical protein